MAGPRSTIKSGPLCEMEFLDTLRPSEEVSNNALVYFLPRLWPRIAKIIEEYLDSQDITSTISTMVQERGGTEPPLVPWIIIKVTSILEDMTNMDLAKEVKDLLVSHGLNNPLYRVYVIANKTSSSGSTDESVLGLEDSKSTLAKSDSSEAVIITSTTPETPEKVPESSPVPNQFEEALKVAVVKGKGKMEPARSVKHLTCWYWMYSQKGCIKSAQQCSYAHVDTGRYAEQPRSIIPGGPRLAGRNANRVEATIREGLAMHLGMDAPLSAAAAAAALAAERNKNDNGSSTADTTNRFAPSAIIREDGYTTPIAPYNGRFAGRSSQFNSRGRFGRGRTRGGRFSGNHYQHRQRQELVGSSSQQTTATPTPDSSPSSEDGYVGPKTYGVPLSPSTITNTANSTTRGTPTKLNRQQQKRANRKNKAENKKHGVFNDLILANTHVNWACHELCVGLDHGLTQLKDVIDKTSELQGALTSINNALDTYDDINTALSMKKTLNTLIADSQAAIDIVTDYRNRAEDCLRADAHAKNAFGWGDLTDEQIGRGRADLGAGIADAVDGPAIAAGTTTAVTANAATLSSESTRSESGLEEIKRGIKKGSEKEVEKESEPEAEEEVETGKEEISSGDSESDGGVPLTS